jgi:type I restriction enzyme S subunit
MRIVKIGEVCEIKGGKRLPKGEKLLISKTDYPYIRVTDFDNAGSVSQRDIRYISRSVHELIARYTISTNDVFLSIAGTIGVTGIVPIDLDGAHLTENACKLVPSPEIDKRYLYYFTRTQSFKDQALAEIRQTAQPKLALIRIKNIQIPLPPIDVQRQIVVKLDATFEKVEKALEYTRKNIQYTQTLFENILTDTFSNLASPVLKRLGDVYDVRDGTHDSPKYHNEGYPLVTSKNLKSGILSLDNVQYISEADYMKINARSRVDRGDVLMAMIGTIGNPVIIESEPNYAIKNVALFKPLNGHDGRFLKYYLQSGYTVRKMENDAKGATQRFVSLGYLRSFNFPVVTPEQESLAVEKMDKITQATQSLNEKYILKLIALNKFKESMLSLSFTGSAVK